MMMWSWSRVSFVCLFSESSLDPLEHCQQELEPFPTYLVSRPRTNTINHALVWTLLYLLPHFLHVTPARAQLRSASALDRAAAR